MNFRMAEYRAMLHQIYDHPVKQYVIYMGKKRLTTPHRINLPGFKYEYNLINFADLPHELFLESKEPEEQILAVLANMNNTSSVQVVKSVLEKIALANPECSTNNKYYEQLRVIMQLRKFDNETENAMLDVNSFWKLERDPLYKKGIEEKSHVVIENLIVKLGLSDEQAADVAEVSINFVKKVRKELAVNK